MGLKVKRRHRAEQLIDPRVVKAISAPIRTEILADCSIAPISQSEFRARQGNRHSAQLIAHHFEVLVECDAIEVTFTRRVKGSLVNYYQAAARALFSEEDFVHLPEALKGCFSALVCSSFQEQAFQSLLANLFDSRSERHATWTPLRLDLAGFLAIVKKLDEIFYWLSVEQAEADRRMELSGEDPMYVTVGMFGFESPAPEREHDQLRVPRP